MTRTQVGERTIKILLPVALGTEDAQILRAEVPAKRGVYKVFPWGTLDRDSHSEEDYAYVAVGQNAQYVAYGRGPNPPSFNRLEWHPVENGRVLLNCPTYRW